MKRISDGIYLIDTIYLNRKDYAGTYILVDNGVIAIIETNTNHAIPEILESLKELNIKKEQVNYIILTHIHLDHAGGAGLLMKELPNTKLIIHQRGKRHMVDPTKLTESVKTVYGEDDYKRMYGDILPIDENRIISVEKEFSVELGKRELFLFESTGHAKHHISIFDKKTRTLFSGDSFGIAYPRFKFGNEQLIFPSTSPTQFDSESALKTIERSIALYPERICLTHFGEITNIKSAANQLQDWITFLISTAENFYNSGLRKNDLSDKLELSIYERFELEIKKYNKDGLSKNDKDLLKIDFELNAKGVSYFIEKNRT